MVMLPPMFPRFNAAVIHLCNVVNPRGYTLLPDTLAPRTLRQLIEAEHMAGGRMPVSRGNSGWTIYGDPEVNYQFRAWHDRTHMLIGAEFTLAGEHRVCAAMQADCAKIYGAKESKLFALILDAEVNGQAEYFDRYGRFPNDQRAYMAGHTCYPALVRAGIAVYDTPFGGRWGMKAYASTGACV